MINHTKSPFKSHTGLMGATEPCQRVTKKNVHFLPAGSVVRLKDNSRLIHLHDDLWLWCCDHAHCYDYIDTLKYKLEKGAVLCHIP